MWCKDRLFEEKLKGGILFFYFKEQFKSNDIMFATLFKRACSLLPRPPGLVPRHPPTELMHGVATQCQD
ncbi:hypothetical protein D0T84_14110 [Dysgonomonas sp. 521]|nr:hypothetical protein [Dysgonomonas sp. 521]